MAVAGSFPTEAAHAIFSGNGCASLFIQGNWLPIPCCCVQIPRPPGGQPLEPYCAMESREGPSWTCRCFFSTESATPARVMRLAYMAFLFAGHSSPDIRVHGNWTRVHSFSLTVSGSK